MGKTRRGNMHEDTQAKAGWTAQPSALHALKRGEGLAVRRSQTSAPAPHLAVPSATLRPHSPPQSSPQGPSPLLPSCIRTWEDGSPPLEFPSPSFIYFTELKHFFIVKLKTYRKDARIAQWTPPYLSFMFAVTIFSICFVVPSPSPPSIYNFFSETSERKLKTW